MGNALGKDRSAKIGNDVLDLPAVSESDHLVVNIAKPILVRSRGSGAATRAVDTRTDATDGV